MRPCWSDITLAGLSCPVFLSWWQLWGFHWLWRGAIFSLRTFLADVFGMSRVLQLSCVWVGMNHLVLVGRIELVPGFWVVLLVPEAVNTKRSRTSTMKGGGEQKWQEISLKKIKCGERRCWTGTVERKQDTIERCLVEERWLWDEVNCEFSPVIWQRFRSLTKVWIKRWWSISPPLPLAEHHHCQITHKERAIV